MVVNPLVEQGHLEFIEHPAHKRSRLVGLIEQGRAAVEELGRREMGFLRAWEFTVKEEQVLSAAMTLRQLREMMESNYWRQALDGRQNP